MDYARPPGWLVLVERFANNWLCSPVYGKFVRSLSLKGTETVLDFGSGGGAGARHLARALEKGGGKLVCVDISETWLEEAKRNLSRYANVEFRLGDIFSAGLQNGGMDLIVVHWMLHDVEPGVRGETVKALVGKLRKDGELVIREPVKAGHGISREEVRGMMEAAGLSEESFRFERVFLHNCYRAVYRRKKSLEEQMEEFARGEG